MAVKLTERDVRLVKDVTLSHVLSRDQIVELGYFGSVTRLNTRLRGLVEIEMIRRFETPFFGQSLYIAGRKAGQVVGKRIAPILANRLGSPRFIQHALAVTNVRIAVLNRGAEHWRFEQQVTTAFSSGGRNWEVRPDGLFTAPSGTVAVEVDLGHVSAKKFTEKLRAYDAFIRSGAVSRAWERSSFSLLTVTTSPKRVEHLATLLSPRSAFEHVFRTFADLDVTTPGNWS